VLAVRRTETECRRAIDAATIRVRINQQPPSVNNIYSQGRFGKYLNPNVKAYRLALATVAKPRLQGLPPGVYEAVVLIGGSFVTKKRTGRAVDLDNMLKTVFDTLQDTGLFKDERIWRIRCEKVYSEVEYTEVALIPLGDLVQWERPC
jgi:Holliday junction resolvase RusA-like endonuclease